MGGKAKSEVPRLVVLLAGNPNSGKTSLFRMMRAQVARYARAVAGGPAYQSFRVA